MPQNLPVDGMVAIVSLGVARRKERELSGHQNGLCYKKTIGQKMATGLRSKKNLLHLSPSSNILFLVVFILME